jgi:hypothetical protein
MGPHPGDRLRAAVAGGMGALWGLGLARLVAEVCLWPPLHGSPLAVATAALICAALWPWLGSLSHIPTPTHPISPLVIGHWSLVIPLAFPLLYVTGITPHPLAGGVLLVGGGVLSLLLTWGERRPWIPPTTLGLTALGLYLRTLLPSVGQADTFEFQVVVPRLAVAHPTGYPLYVLAGKGFTLLPIGNPAWRVSLASAVFATAAVLVLYALLLRLALPRQAEGAARWLPAFLAALAFAFSSTFWSQAVIAEVYTLHNLLVATILYLLLLPHPATATHPRRWQAIFFLSGLSFTNHLTTALLLPAVVLALLWDRPRLRLKDWLIAGGLALLGLSLYLFIPLRWPAVNRGEWMTLQQFMAHVTGGQFHGALRLDGWRDPTRWEIVGRLLRTPFGWIGLGLAAAGVVRMAVRQRQALAITSATFLAFVLYGLDYHIPDISVFLLPAHLILAVWIGTGIAALTALFSRFRHPTLVIRHCSLFIVQCSLVILIALLPLSRIWLNFPLVDQSHNDGNLAWGQYVLSLPLAADGAVLADVEKFAPLYYLQQIGGRRPDLDLLLLGSEELYQAELAARLEKGQTVYLARYLPHLAGLHLRSVGPLVEVSGADEEGVCEDGIGVGFGQEIRLLSAEVSADPLGRALHHVTLTWRADAEVSGDFYVRLRLVDADGRVRWESDGVRPVGGLYPTNAWPAGIAISDYHEVSPPPWLPRGEYRLEVGLFPPFSDAGLAVDGEPTAWLAVSPLDVAPPTGPLPPLPYQRRYSFSGGAWLTGHDLPGEAFSGAPLVADFSWRRAEADEELRLTWVDVNGQEVRATTSPLTAGAVRSRHVITAPQSPGEYTLHVGLVGETVRCRWLAPQTAACPLAAVEIVPAQAGLANFAGLVLLLDAEVGRAHAQPGETVPVTLQWRALRAMDEDYTAFVHLVGPDGRLHGQVDMWPVQGSHPTSQWTPGEEIRDPYDVRLEPNAPPGHYRVEIGWYLLATMQRLYVVSADGHSIGDSFVAGDFDVGD